MYLLIVNSIKISAFIVCKIMIYDFADDECQEIYVGYSSFPMRSSRCFILMEEAVYTLNIRSPYVGNGQSFSGTFISSSSARARRLCIEEKMMSR